MGYMGQPMRPRQLQRRVSASLSLVLSPVASFMKEGWKRHLRPQPARWGTIGVQRSVDASCHDADLSWPLRGLCTRAQPAPCDHTLIKLHRVLVGSSAAL